MTGMRRVLLLALAQSSVLAALTPPAVVGLSLIAQRWGSTADAPALLSVALACGAIAAMVCNPLFGRLVDRTPPRLGGRRPWLVLGAIGGLGGSAWVATATGPLEVTIAWAATQASYNASFAAVNGLLSVGLRARDRTRAAGVLAAVSYVGTLPGLAVAALFPTDILMMTVLLPVIALVATSAVALTVTETKAAEHRSRPRGELGALLSRPFLVAFGVRFALATELTAGLVYGVYLFQERWGFADADAVRWVSLTTLGGATGLVVAAVVLAVVPAARTRPAALLGAAVLGTAAAMLGRGLAPTPELFLCASVLAGASIGIGSTVSRAVVQGVLPPERAAFGLGVFNVAGMSAAAIAPLVASGFLAVGSTLAAADPYRAYYLLFAAPMPLLLIPLRLGRRSLAATQQPAAGETEGESSLETVRHGRLRT